MAETSHSPSSKPNPLKMISFTTAMGYGLGLIIGPGAFSPSTKGTALKNAHRAGTKMAGYAFLLCSLDLATERIINGGAPMEEPKTEVKAKAKAKETFPSSSQITRPLPSIEETPTFAAKGFGVGAMCSAISPLIRGKDWRASVRANTLRFGLKVGAVSGLYCILGNTLPYIRKKEDDWNGIVAFGLSSGVMFLHRNLAGMGRGMVGSSALYCLIYAAADSIRSSEKREAVSIGNFATDGCKDAVSGNP